MVRVKQHPKKEIIDFHIEEIGLMINKLYHTLNKKNVCDLCGKRSEFIRVVVNDMTKVKVFKICRKCVVDDKG
jgi:superfamily II helicase